MKKLPEIDRKTKLQSEILQLEQALAAFEAEKQLPPGVSLNASGSLFEQIKQAADQKETQQQKAVETRRLLQASRDRLEHCRLELDRIEYQEREQAIADEEHQMMVEMQLLSDRYNSLARQLEEVALLILQHDSVEPMRQRRVDRNSYYRVIAGCPPRLRTVFGNDPKKTIVEFRSEPLL